MLRLYFTFGGTAMRKCLYVQVLFLAMLSLFVGCAASENDQTALNSAKDEVAAKAEPAPVVAVPYYLVWRGFKRIDVKNEAFNKTLVEKIVPTVPKVYGTQGLLAFLAAVPTPVVKKRPNPVPSEISLLVFESKAAYEKALQSPDIKKFNDSRWEIFDQKTSSAEAPILFDPAKTKLSSGKAYDLYGEGLDWRTGHNTVYIGLRKSGLKQSEFMRRLTAHLKQASQAMKPKGLRGYVVLATEDYEIAWQNWKDQAAYDAAMNSDEAKPIITDAGSIMDNGLYAGAKVFDGTLKPGEMAIVK